MYDAFTPGLFRPTAYEIGVAFHRHIKEMFRPRTLDKWLEVWRTKYTFTFGRKPERVSWAELLSKQAIKVHPEDGPKRIAADPLGQPVYIGDFLSDGQGGEIVQALGTAIFGGNVYVLLGRYTDTFQGAAYESSLVAATSLDDLANGTLLNMSRLYRRTFPLSDLLDLRPSKQASGKPQAENILAERKAVCLT